MGTGWQTSARHLIEILLVQFFVRLAQNRLTSPPLRGDASRRPRPSAGGSNGRWSRDDRELYFIASDKTLMAAPLDAAGVPGPPRALFNVAAWLDYDVADDGRIVAVVREVVGAEQPLAVFVNWRGR